MNATTEIAAKSTPAKKPEPQPLNGVRTPELFATIGAVKTNPELAKFTFRAENRWQSGTHSRTTIGTFSGAGGDHQHEAEFAYDGDHPKVLCGEGNGPTPVEYLLHALASCLMAGVANVAAARGVELTEVVCKLEGYADLQGILGLNDQVRNGYEKIRVDFSIKGKGSPEQLAAVIEQSRNRSAVFDVITNGVPVEINIDAG